MRLNGAPPASLRALIPHKPLAWLLLLTFASISSCAYVKLALRAGGRQFRSAQSLSWNATTSTCTVIVRCQTYIGVQRYLWLVYARNALPAGFILSALLMGSRWGCLSLSPFFYLPVSTDYTVVCMLRRLHSLSRLQPERAEPRNWRQGVCMHAVPYVIFRELNRGCMG